MTSQLRLQSAAEGALSIVQREFPNYHPLAALARLAHAKEVIEDPKLEFEIHKAILPYVTPKLSSVEVKDNREDDRRVIVSLFETQTLENGQIIDVEVPLVREVSEIVPLD